MNRYLRSLVPIATVAAALGCAAPGVALAGTYTASINTASSPGGWVLNQPGGFTGCSSASYPGVCADKDISRPAPLLIFGTGDAISGAVAMWSWVAPAGLSIAKGTVGVQFRTNAAGVSVYLKTHGANQSFEGQTALDATTGDGSATWAIPGGNTTAIGLALKSAQKHSFGANKWENNLQVKSLSLSLTDPSDPTAAVSGPLAAGQWLNQSSKVCLTVAAADTGSGVASLALEDASGHTLDSYAVPAQTALQPGLMNVSHDLCVVPSALVEGVQQESVVVTDASGQAVTLPVSVKVDTAPPAARSELPASRTTNRRAPISFSVDPGPSGLASFTADVDGSPMTISGSSASLTPEADLSLGTHTVHFKAVDGAGNVKQDSWTFVVAAAFPTSITASGPDSITVGTPTHIEFKLIGDAAAVSGAKVLLQTRVGNGAYDDGRELAAATNGMVEVPVAPSHTSTYRLSVVGDAAVSATWQIVVIQKLRLAASAHVMRFGRHLRLRPWIPGDSARFKVTLEVRLGNGRWVTIGSPRLNTALNILPLRRGRFQFRAVGPKTGQNHTTSSRTITVIVR